MCHLLLIFIRRLVMLSILCFLPNFGYGQIVAQLITTLVLMFFTAYVKPFESRMMNIQETVNEWCVILGGYHLLCFTEWIHDINRRFELGWSLVGVIGINVFFNFTVMLTMVIKKAFRKIKLWKLKRDYMRNMIMRNI